MDQPDRRPEPDGGGGPEPDRGGPGLDGGDPARDRDDPGPDGGRGPDPSGPDQVWVPV